jgi:hypothetical protein
MRIRGIVAVCTVGILGLAVTPGAATAATDHSRLTRVSPADPYAGCSLGAESGTNFPGAEVEPSISVAPFDPNRVIGVFQQDRWSDGGAKGLVAAYSTDHGQHFAETPLPFSACTPGGLPYERASDAWVSIGPDGTAYASGLNFDAQGARNGVAAAVSHDGGRTWTHVTELISDTQAEFVDDKNSVTADPVRIGTAYQVWDRLDFGPTGNTFTGPAFLSVTHDFGRTWSPARPIVNTVDNQQTIGNVIVADPRTGRLYDVFTLITGPTATMSIIRSDDGGRTWTTPATAATDTSIGDVDPNTGAALRTGAGLPSVALDRVTGALYVVYPGTDFTAGKLNQIQLVRSTNGGRTWSAPQRVNGQPQAEAFTPSVTVRDDGTVAVTYYDIRTLQPGNTTTLPTTTWLTTSPRGGTDFGDERQIAPAFDALLAPNAGGFMVGDYEGLANAGDGVRPLFEVTNTGQPAHPTDIVTGTFAAEPHDSVRAPSFATATRALPQRGPRTLR